MRLRIAISATPLFWHSCKMPGVWGDTTMPSLKKNLKSLSISFGMHHTGSEEGCNPDGTGINIGAARLAVKDELDHREFWSGRWESNPRPKLGKLLYCHCTTPAHFHTDSLIHDLTTFNRRQDGVKMHSLICKVLPECQGRDLAHRHGWTQEFLRGVYATTSGLQERRPHLHGRCCAVSPRVIRNKGQRHSSALQRRAVIPEVQSIA